MSDRRTCMTREAQENERVARKQAEWSTLRTRFLNPNIRTTGRDESALTRQIEEKRRREHEEKMEDKRYADFVTNVGNFLRESDISASESKAREKAELNATWARQIAEQKAVRDAVPEEEPVGVSSAQQFDGEDASALKRRAVQHAQMRKWTRQQQQEKLQREADERAANDAYGAHLAATCDRLDVIDAEAAAAALARKVAIQDYNHELARQAAAERAAYLHEQKTGEFPLLDAGMMGESVDRGTSHLPGRYRPDHYKGMRDEERKEIRSFQADQILEKQRKLREERAAEREWSDHRKHILNVADNVSAQQLGAATMVNCEVAARNVAEGRAKAEAAAAAAAAHKSDPVFGKAFFQQFGTSHR